MPTRPGKAELPVRSRRRAFAGICTEPLGPSAAILPSEMRMVWSFFTGAPVPSITRRCSRAITPPGTLMKSLVVGPDCGWAKPRATQQRRVSKAGTRRMIGGASRVSGTMQNNRGLNPLQMAATALWHAIALFDHRLQDLIKRRSLHDQELHFESRRLPRGQRNLRVHVLASEFGVTPHVAGLAREAGRHPLAVRGDG